MAIHKIFIGESNEELECFINEEKSVYLSIAPLDSAIEYFRFENESEIDQFIEELNKLKFKVYGK